MNVDNYGNSISTRDMKIDLLQGRYKAISAYKIPDRPSEWKECPNCHLKPLTWEFNNGSSTACGCGENEYRHFSIHTESIMSYVTRHNGSALNYPTDGLRVNWNHWCKTGEIRESFDELKSLGRW